MVFDSSAKFQGVSLNDVLLICDNINNSLLGVLIRFRDPLQWQSQLTFSKCFIVSLYVKTTQTISDSSGIETMTQAKT